MTDTVINEQALRELIREALDDKDRFQVMADPLVSPMDQLPVPVNPSVDSMGSCAGLDVSPLDTQFVPRDRVEFEVALKSLVKNVPDEVIPQLYLKVREIVVDEQEKDTVEPGEEQMSKTEPELETEGLRKIIRTLIDEARMGLGGQTVHDDPFDDDDDGFDGLKAQDDFDDPGFAEPGAGGGADITRADDIGDDWEDDPFDDDGEVAASAWDPEPTDDEDEKPSAKKRGKTGHGYGFSDEGKSFEEIATQLGISVSGAKRLEREALKKLAFMNDLDQEDRRDILLQGVADYVKFLGKSGELSKDDIAFMMKNPDLVMELEGFREHLHKTVMKAMKEKGLSADDESDDE